MINQLELKLFFVVATHLDDLTALELPAAFAGAVCKVRLATVRALAQLRSSEILVATAVSTTMAGYFSFRYCTHEFRSPLF
jgi:hypothetical protein